MQHSKGIQTISCCFGAQLQKECQSVDDQTELTPVQLDPDALLRLTMGHLPAKRQIQ